MDLLGRLIEVQNGLAALVAGPGCPPAATWGRRLAAHPAAFVALVLVLWAGVHRAFAACTQALLLRMGLTRVRAGRAAAAAWEAGAAAGAALLSAAQLDGRPSAASAEWPPAHVAAYVAVVAACQAEALWRRPDAEAATRLLVPVAALAARWPDLGFEFCLHASGVQLLRQIGRLALSLRLRTTALCFFCAFALAWCACYSYLMPGWMQSVAAAPPAADDLGPGLVFLLAALVAHAIAAFLHSPVASWVRGVVGGCSVSEWLEVSLFPSTDLRLSRLQQRLCRPEEPRPQRHNNQSGARTLYQLMRCRTLLQRKARAMRDRNSPSTTS
ncbi:uncharacterized protein LOC135937962 isoform X2 [Cloeon dipterum]|uniref:uncharacterized protein LOC135937962 isoform X2 n=1 Tax=Cloeon dipterum TaxID=197152 RepID=UPI00322090DC